MLTLIVHGTERVELYAKLAAEYQIRLQSVLSLDRNASFLGRLLLEISSFVLGSGFPCSIFLPVLIRR